MLSCVCFLALGRMEFFVPMGFHTFLLGLTSALDCSIGLLTNTENWTVNKLKRNFFCFNTSGVTDLAAFEPP